MLTSYIHGSILKMLQGSKAHILFSLCWDRKEAIMLLKLIMLDECGDETVVETYNVRDDLDETFMDVWEDKTIEDVAKEYPEACGFYFEKSEETQGRFNYMSHGYEDDYSDEWGEFEEMMSCDYNGFCAGESCPMFWKCRH